MQGSFGIQGQFRKRLFFRCVCGRAVVLAVVAVAVMVLVVVVVCVRASVRA